MNTHSTQKLIKAVEGLKTPEDKMLGGMANVIPLTVNNTIDQVIALIRKHEVGLPVVRLDKYVPQLSDEGVVEVYVAEDVFTTARKVRGGFMVPIIAKNGDRTQCETAKPTAQRWQPIETAPRDGTEVLVTSFLYGKIERFQWVAKYHSDHGWLNALEDELDIPSRINPPTHWMPLPTPPALKEEV